MLQNIKVDIIYYLTQTDFEMEFNLCGCCRMRLLTDKASDRKEFIHMLSRAVSRSRVTISCGKIEGDTGLVRSIAAAIGKNVVKVNNDAYGIRGAKECFVIEGSMPLVSPDGVFGGCIIESGPQAIIILTENRSVRKSIMNTLIHPYIEEVSINDAKSTLSENVERVAQENLVEQTEDPKAQENETAQELVQEEEKDSAEEAETAGPSVADVAVQAVSIDVAAQAVDAMENAVSKDNEQTAEEEPESIEEDIHSQEDIAQDPAAAQFQKLYEETKEDSQAEQEPQVQDEDITETQPQAANEEEAETATEEKEETETDAQPEETVQEAEKDQFDINSLLTQQEDKHDFSFARETEETDFSYDSIDDIDYDEDSDDDYLNDDYYNENDEKEYKSGKLRLPIMILAVIAIIMILILAYILIFIPFSKGYNFNEYIRELFAVSKVGIKWF